MSLAFGGEFDPGMHIGLFPGRPDGRSRRRLHGATALDIWRLAHDLAPRMAALLGWRKPAFASAVASMEDEAEAVWTELGEIAPAVGLSEDEWAALLGGGELSRVVLALETLSAALKLFPGAPEVAAWLRAECSDAPFSGESPLQSIKANGRLGVEITLLHLQARLRWH